MNGAKQLRLDAADLNAEDSGDLTQFHLFNKSQCEDGLLLGGELCGCLPDGLEFGPREEGLLGSGSRGREVEGFCSAVVRESEKLLPETDFAAAGMVAGEVDSDAEEPGLNAGLAAKSVQILKSAEETFLGEGIGIVGIADENEENAIHAALMRADDLVKRSEVDSMGGQRGRYRIRQRSLHQK